MRLNDLRPESVTAIEAVRAALQVIAARVDASVINEKGHMDIATGTDIRSEEVIRSILETGYSEHGLVGEESAEHDAPPRRSYWLVDPICGTRNFASRLPLYAVNIALVEDREVTLAAVGDGALREVWVAERERGSWAVSHSSLRPISASPASQTIVLDPGRPGGPASAKAATVISAAILDGQREIRTLGTSLDLAYLASGRVAAVWHFSQIPPLHFAAGTLLATQSGAKVTDENGVPWTIDSTSLVAAATPTLHKWLLGLLSSDLEGVHRRP